MRKPFTLLAALLLPILAASNVAAQDSSWVHLRVEESDEVQMRLNLPVSMVSVMFESVRSEALQDLDRDGGDVGFADARVLWQSMRDAGDAEFLDIRDGDERMRVFREGDRVFVHGEADDGTEVMRVEMPVALADALLSEEAETADLESIIESLVRAGESELVLIRDGDATVRIWADDRNGQD